MPKEYEYVVFWQGEGNSNMWADLGVFKGENPNEAIRQAASETSDPSGYFFAVSQKFVVKKKVVAETVRQLFVVRDDAQEDVATTVTTPEDPPAAA